MLKLTQEELNKRIMDWILRSPQIHSTFGNLGFTYGDGYHIYENCNAALETILHNILNEDKYFRTYRRSLSIGQNVKKDLIPLLIHAKADKTIELLIRILVNLTTPVECLFPLETISKTDLGRHAIFEINSLLSVTKHSFTDLRVTKVVIDFIKKNVDLEKQSELSPEQCANISNSLLLFRNILHIPEENSNANPNHNGSCHAIQNQILWNIFSQSIDKVLIRLMTIPESAQWGVTMVQFIALIYKDQHVVTLRKLLNIWLESSLSESSEDNESNTSLPDRASGYTSSMITSDPTSDSSDTGGSGKSNDDPNSVNHAWTSVSNSPEIEPGASNERKQFDSETNTTMLLETNNASDHSENNNMNTDEDKQVEYDEMMPLFHQDQTLSFVQNSTMMAYNEEGARNSFEQNQMLTHFEQDQIMANYQQNEAMDYEEEMKSFEQNEVKNATHDERKTLFEHDKSSTSGINESEENRSVQSSTHIDKTAKISEASDYGYGTQIENPESISTSSNEDELPAKKHKHQKPHIPKIRINNKVRCNMTLQERKRKKLVKRGKSNIINVQGLSHKTPTDDDISNVLKEFTVDFLLKGYNSLVHTLHNQILTNINLEIDTSHFFWLVTYFLKFASQIELNLDHIRSVLSIDIISYLTAEGVNLCEEFELTLKLEANNLKPIVRRLHLAVTAIREFIQAVESYKKVSHLCAEDQESLTKLQMKMCETEELKLLLLLLLRHFNPKYQSKQYLQDLIVTNHKLLMFSDSVMKLPEYKGTANTLDHMKQFATPEMMYRYGILLEDYEGNGEFVNDCIFTLMHHVGGDLGSSSSLFQPKILKTFTSIWNSEFEICDDWSDLIEYVINTFIKKPHALQSAANIGFDTESFEEECALLKQVETTDPPYPDNEQLENSNDYADTIDKIWTEEELCSLSWHYMQCSSSSEVISDIIKLFKEDDIIKSRYSIVNELFNQNLLTKEEFEKLMKSETYRSAKKNYEIALHKEMKDDEIRKMSTTLMQEGYGYFISWVQKVLLDTCFAKINLEKRKSQYQVPQKNVSKIMNFDLFKEKISDLPIKSDVSYHALMLNQSVPVVPWNYEQAAYCKNLRLLQLLHKLGFYMPVDTGKLFIRIPHFWTADLLYETAAKIAPIDTSKLQFSINDICDSSLVNSTSKNYFACSSNHTNEISATICTPTDKSYPRHKQNNISTMINFTPKLEPSFIIEEEVNKSTEKDQQNWFEMITKSQETKSILKPTSLVHDAPASSCAPAAAIPEAASAPLAALFAIHPLPEEFEDNNSVCETASVTSDLTRMYVSDDEEKAEFLRPVVAPTAAGLVAPTPAPSLKAPAPARSLKAPAPAPSLMAPASAPSLMAPAPAPSLMAPAPAPSLKVPAPALRLMAPAPAPSLMASGLVAPDLVPVVAPAFTSPTDDSSDSAVPGKKPRVL